MSKVKIKEDKIKTSIPPYIIDSISSLTPKHLIHSESCPIEALDIQEKLDGNLKKREKVRETEYKIGNYLIKKTLGQGTFGKVKLGIYLPTQEKVAVKILEKERIIEKDDEIRVKREFDMLAQFNHPNVILVAEIFESSDSFYSVMEYCEGGELFNYIVKNRRLSEEEAAFFYYQLINGLEYIHSLGIVHRDLKPENLLLTSEHLLKIIDFGLSNYFKEGQKDLLITPCGSPCYASPEMVGGHKYNGFKIDIWSSGIILYAMLCGYLPFEDKDNDILFEKILECKLVYPKYITNTSKDLIEKILVTDPEARITIPEIKKHPFYLKGKDLFEQEFSVYQITKDDDNKASFVENIELNHILDNTLLIETDKEKEKIEDIENKENKDINNQKRINENNNINNLAEKKVVEKETSEKNNKSEKIKEIEIKNLGIEVIDIKKDVIKDNKKEKEKEKEKDNNTNKKPSEITKKINKETPTCELNLDDNIHPNEEMNKNKKGEKINISNNNGIIDSKINESKENNRNVSNLQNIQNIDSINKNKSKDKNISKNKINKKQSKNISINITSKNLDFFKNNHKFVTLIKDKDSNMRRRLIKNKPKLNIREKTKSKPRVFTNSNKVNEIINYDYFKRHLINKKRVEITPNMKNIKDKNKTLISKRINNSKLFQKRYSSKGSINKRRLDYKINAYSNNINNTIDNEYIPKKIKLYFNFHKINISYVNSSKRASSLSKHNMKLTSFETSKIKKLKKNFDSLYENTSSIKKHLETSNNNKKLSKFNLLYKKNLKEINLNMKNNRRKNSTDKKKTLKILKTEIRKDKGKNLLEIKRIKKMKLSDIKMEKNNNTNIKIIDNTKNEEEINDKIIQKNYNTKTNIKKANYNNIYKKIQESNNEYIIKTFDREKNQHYKKQHLNKYSRISGTLNTNYLKKLEKKKTIDEDDKFRRINIDMYTNIGINSKNNIGNNNNNKEINNSKKKLVKKDNKNEIKKNVISKKDLLNINIDLNNKKEQLKDMYMNDKKSNLKNMENILKTEPNKKLSIAQKKNLNSEKYTKINFSHQKIVPINQIKISKYRKSQWNTKKQNIPKILNKTSNNTNFNSFIKNPFIQTETSNFNTINQSTNNTNVATNSTNQTQNTIIKKPFNNKNSQKVLNKYKKKPYVTIRNTVINFNMIDSGLILSSLNRKKEGRKKMSTIGQNNSLNRLHSNHLYGLCNKFNSNLIPNINSSNIHGDISIKNKTINVNNNNMHINGTKIANYREKYIRNFKKISNLNNKQTMNNYDKFHMKFNSMRLEDLNYLKGKKKKLNNKNKIASYSNNKMINNEQTIFNTNGDEKNIYQENYNNFDKNEK